MANGSVKWSNTQKGSGYIAPAHGSKGIFVHVCALERAGLHPLDEGKNVTFDIESDREGRDTAFNLALA
ncbi:cold-shock protein [Thiosulfatihalobacter marinus]|uniref:cold-shock protein n=1 Tax=Thiosulfatihalobacter marinus TaxID=2792481 RepID=UPI0018D8B241|nr:cold shock domain-containing protein [Thiosulfatihalobacter marinus]